MISNWKRVLIVILVLFVSLSFTYARSGSGKSFLWEIIPPSGQSSYLLGSVHMMKQSHYPLKPVIEEAFEKTKVLAVEIDLTGPNMMAVAMKLINESSYKGKETLKDNISNSTFKLVEKKLAQQGTSYEAFKKSKPWMLAITILQSELAKLGFFAQYGIDMHFLGKAAGKKEVVELEGAEFQLKLFLGMNRSEQEQFLLTTIKEAEQFQKEFKQIIDAWLNGDADSMYSLLVEYSKKDPSSATMMKKMLDDRNVGMTEKIVKLLSSGKPVFVVVGAAHMIGPKGIVKMLQDRGYKVVQR